MARARRRAAAAMPKAPPVGAKILTVRLPKGLAPASMSGAERKYAERLEMARLAGEIKKWEFEPDVLILSSRRRCSYKPDFKVWLTARKFEYHETKSEHTLVTYEDGVVKIEVGGREIQRSNLSIMCVS